MVHTELILSEIKNLDIDWNEVDYNEEDLLKGYYVELEHGSTNPETNVTDDNIQTTLKIALAHLNEDPDYYEKLEEMEQSDETASEGFVESVSNFLFNRFNHLN